MSDEPSPSRSTSEPFDGSWNARRSLLPVVAMFLPVTAICSVVAWGYLKGDDTAAPLAQHKTATQNGAAAYPSGTVELLGGSSAEDDDFSSDTAAPRKLNLPQTTAAEIVPVAGSSQVASVSKYIIQVQVIQVDAQGVQNVIATPRMQSLGGTSGFIHEDASGRVIEFSATIREPGSAMAGLTPPGAKPAGNGPGALRLSPDGHYETAAEASSGMTIGQPLPQPSMPTVSGDRVAALPPVQSPEPKPATVPSLIAKNPDARNLLAQAPVPLPVEIPSTPKAVVPEAIGIQQVTEKLQRKITVKIENQSRRDALRKVGQEAGFNIVIDPESAAAVKQALDTSITFAADDQPAQDVLTQLVQPLDLDYAVRHEVVLIAHAEKVRPQPQDYHIMTYPIEDLLAASGGPFEFDTLTDHLRKYAAPKSWGEGQSASIKVFKSTNSLVVRQTDSGHAAIAQCLKQLRERTSSRPTTP